MRRGWKRGGRGCSPCTGAGLVEEGEGDRAGHLRPHFPGAAEHGGPVEQALEVLGLGLIPWEGRQSIPSFLRSFLRSRGGGWGYHEPYLREIVGLGDQKNLGLRVSLSLPVWWPQVRE